MNMDRVKYIEVDGRKFQVHKFDAKASLKIAKLIIAKILPMLDTFLPALLHDGMPKNANDIPAKIADADTLGDLFSALSLEKVAHALDLIDEADLDRIIDISLRHCYEALPAGPVRVLNADGTYSVDGVEFDMLLMLRLTAEAVLGSAGGFFDASRWTSMFKPLAASFPRSA